ncbi:hypothetical protein PPYR_09840 [Photinus pyralis]|uniref:Protein sleepless n=1 Tax=Photinus pyralis TaxID=7054 RepID=A0A5N4AEP8_PHOPY|nr:hypothetical protein PPYR_09840 [Photinus pyralis]
MYFKILLATVTLFLWSFSSSEALNCINCHGSSAACRKGSVTYTQPCTANGSYSEAFCFSAETVNGYVLRGCASKQGTGTLCEILERFNRAYTNCKSCSRDMCNSFNYGS